MNSSQRVNSTERDLTDDQFITRKSTDQAALIQTGIVYLLEKSVPYAVAWRWQRQLVEQYKSVMTSGSSDVSDRLLLLQHPPVYTLGQGADPKFLRFDPSNTAYEIHRVERGGEVTYHCPGQLVGYPILNLKAYKPDLHWYLRQLEEVLIRTLDHYGLKAERVPGMTGVWYQGHKLAAIGIKVSRWITMHGFALNVCPDLRGFEKIVPCGLEGQAVGSMAQFLPEVEFNAVRQVVIEQFEQVFGLRLINASVSDVKRLDLAALDLKIDFQER